MLARSTRRSPSPELISRVVGEFREMPGLSVTLAQAARLFNLSGEECGGLFDELRRRGLIEVTTQGLYRRHSGE
jgi:hypothetical protein